MKINKNTFIISDEILLDIKKYETIAIDFAIQEGVLIRLLQIDLINSPNLKLLLACDPEIIDLKNCICNLDILRFFPFIQNIIISVKSCQPLTSIQQLSNINYLKSFTLYGYIKNINLDVLDKFTGQIEFLDIDNMNINKKKYSIINKNPLKKLALAKLDLSLIENNENLTELKIYHELLYEELLHEKFPNLNSLTLINCNKVTNFSAITKMNNLKELTINTVKNFTVMPTLPSNQLEKLAILNNKNFESFANFNDFQHLKELSLTNTKIRSKTIENILTSLPIKRLNFYSQNKDEQKAVEDLIRKYNLTQK